MSQDADGILNVPLRPAIETIISHFSRKVMISDPEVLTASPCNFINSGVVEKNSKLQIDAMTTNSGVILKARQLALKKRHIKVSLEEQYARSIPTRPLAQKRYRPPKSVRRLVITSEGPADCVASTTSLSKLRERGESNLRGSYVGEAWSSDEYSEDDLDEPVLSRETLKGVSEGDLNKPKLRRRRRQHYDVTEKAPQQCNPPVIGKRQIPDDGAECVSFEWNRNNMMQKLIRQEQGKTALENISKEMCQLYSGFVILALVDHDRDGFITEDDLKALFLLHHARVDSSVIKSTLWTIDDARRGALTFEAVKDYYMRIREHLRDWAALLGGSDSATAEQAESLSSGTKRWLWVETDAASADNEGGNPPLPAIASRSGGRSAVGVDAGSTAAVGPLRRYAKKKDQSVSDANDRPIEKLFLYRLLLFVPLLNDCHDGVHLLSALQELVRLYGNTHGESRFEFIFSKKAKFVTDSDYYSLAHFVHLLQGWDDVDSQRIFVTNRQRGLNYAKDRQAKQHCKSPKR